MADTAGAEAIGALVARQLVLRRFEITARWQVDLPARTPPKAKRRRVRRGASVYRDAGGRAVGGGAPAQMRLAVADACWRYETADASGTHTGLWASDGSRLRLITDAGDADLVTDEVGDEPPATQRFLGSWTSWAHDALVDAVRSARLIWLLEDLRLEDPGPPARLVARPRGAEESGYAGVARPEAERVLLVVDSAAGVARELAAELPDGALRLEVTGFAEDVADPAALLADHYPWLQGR